MPGDICPICCTGAACGVWIAEKACFLFECEQCSTFTITSERRAAFETAWRTAAPEVLMYLDAVSRYLRLAGDDEDREVTDATWLQFAVDGQDRGEEDGDRVDDEDNDD